MCVSTYTKTALPTPSSSLPFPLEVGPLIVAGGLGSAVAPQQVQAEPGHQFGEL